MAIGIDPAPLPNERVVVRRLVRVSVVEEDSKEEEEGDAVTVVVLQNEELGDDNTVLATGMTAEPEGAAEDMGAATVEVIELDVISALTTT